MSIHLKRIVFFFCILYFGLGCCLGNLANADPPPENPLFRVFISIISNEYGSRLISGNVFYNGSGLGGVEILASSPSYLIRETKTEFTGYYKVQIEQGVAYTLKPQKDGFQFDPPFRLIPKGPYDIEDQNFTAKLASREISGSIFYNGIGLGGVEILANNIKVAETDGQGYYKTTLTDSAYTLTPRKTGYLFTPESRPIPADQSNYGNQDFTGQTIVTISGNVTWKNISDDTTIQSNPLPGENNLTIPAIMVAVDACAQDGSPCIRIVANPDGTYSIPVPYNWSGSVKPSSLGFEFIPEKLTYSGLKVNKTQQNFQAPLSPNGSVYKITVLVKDQNGNLLPYDPRISIRLDGTNHAKGSRYQYFTVPVRPKWPFSATEWAFSSIPSGWIGDITPSSADYTFTPSSIRVEGIVTGDRAFTFIATSLNPIVFSGTIIWEAVYRQGNPAWPLPAVTINAVARDGAPFSYMVVTGADGKYSIPLPYDWSGSVTPSSPGFFFSPAQTTYYNMRVDWVQNFWVREFPF
jgi:hypothetical protein